jgi:hypothetical protein
MNQKEYGRKWAPHADKSKKMKFAAASAAGHQATGTLS